MWSKNPTLMASIKNVMTISLALKTAAKFKKVNGLLLSAMPTLRAALEAVSPTQTLLSSYKTALRSECKSKHQKNRILCVSD